jgi:hypothetical protein
VNELAGLEPKLTATAPLRLAPVIVTLVPPAVEPDDGLTAVTVGAGTNVYWSALLVALVPPGVVTVTSTVPVPAGVVAMIAVALATVNELAAVPPNLTAVAPVRLVPVIVTLLPPAAGPDDGDTPVTVGAGVGATYVNWSALEVALVPPGVLTVTSTVPALCAGLVAVIWVALLTVNELAGLEPKLTATAPLRLAPVIVTLVPPAVEPDDGETPVTVGAGVGATPSSSVIRESKFSATKRSPDESTATPDGRSNSPAPPWMNPVPSPIWQVLVQVSNWDAPSLTPHPIACMNVPDEENSSTRSLL